MATTWTFEKTPKGANYEQLANGTAFIGEAVEFGYIGKLKNGTYVPPDTVSIRLAPEKGDTGAITESGTVASDTSTSTYTVTLTLPTATTAGLAGNYVYEQTEGRGANTSIPYGGCFFFDERV